MEEQNKQKLLNNLLKGTLYSEHNLDTVNILLDKGADPKCLNVMYDFTFHVREFIRKNNDSVDDVEFLMIRLFDGGFSKVGPRLIEEFVRNGFYTALCRSLEIKYEDIENDTVVYDEYKEYKSVKTRFSEYLFGYVIPVAFEYSYPDMLSFIIRKYSLCPKKVFKLLYESKMIDNKEQLYELLYEKIKNPSVMVTWAFENKDYSLMYLIFSGKGWDDLIEHAFNECKLGLMELLSNDKHLSCFVTTILEEKVQDCEENAKKLIEYLISNKFVETDRAIDNVLLWAARTGNNDILKELLDKRLGGGFAAEDKVDKDYEVIEHVKKHGSLPAGVKFVPNEEK